MGCCGEDKGKKYSAVRTHEKHFKGPIQDRSCTDVICCLIFVIFVVGLFALSVWAFAYGDYRKIVYPTNSKGQLCGIDIKDRTKLYFFNLLECVKATTVATGCLTTQVCVKECPTKQWNMAEALSKEAVMKMKGIWKPEDPGFKALRQKMVCLDGANGLDPRFVDQNVDDLVFEKKCAPFVLPTSSVVGRCFPSAIKDLAKTILTDERNKTVNTSTSALKASSKNLAQFLAVSQVAQNILQDLVNSWHIILIMLIIGLLMSLLWTILLRFFAGIIVWVTLLLFVIVFSFGTGYSFYKYSQLAKEQTKSNTVEFRTDVSYYLSLKETWLGFGIASGVILLIIILMLIFLRERIRIAIALIGEASRAVSHMMSTLLWPFVPFLMQIVIIAYCILVAVFLSSIGKPEGVSLSNRTNLTSVDEARLKLQEACDPSKNNTEGEVCQFVKYEAKKYLLVLQFYNLFMLFWLINFVIALGQMTLAGAFASYYFAFSKPKDIPAFPLLSSFWRCFRYHLGTLAFGSLLIALVQLARAILEYIDQKTKDNQNTVAQFVMKCMKCCLWCLEKFLKFLSKNAFIMTAIYGQNFCTAAKNAFQLILRNVVRVFVVDKVTDFVLFIGKLVVVGAVGSLAFFFFDGTIARKSTTLSKYSPSLHYYFIPVIIVVIGTYAIATLFFSVYSMAVDTLFLCFLEDLERNDGSPEKPYYMSKSLMTILGKKNDPDEPKKKDESAM